MRGEERAIGRETEKERRRYGKRERESGRKRERGDIVM